MSIEKISMERVAELSIESLSARPNLKGRFGVSGLSSRELRRAFDRLPLMALEKINELSRNEQRDQNHIKLAWTSMISIVVVTLLLFTPFVSIERIIALKDILDLFYIAQTSIIGFYMGAKTYLDRNK